MGPLSSSHKAAKIKAVSSTVSARQTNNAASASLKPINQRRTKATKKIASTSRTDSRQSEAVRPPGTAKSQVVTDGRAVKKSGIKSERIALKKMAESLDSEKFLSTSTMARGADFDNRLANTFKDEMGNASACIDGFSPKEFELVEACRAIFPALGGPLTQPKKTAKLDAKLVHASLPDESKRLLLGLVRALDKRLARENKLTQAEIDQCCKEMLADALATMVSRNLQPSIHSDNTQTKAFFNTVFIGKRQAEFRLIDKAAVDRTILKKKGNQAQKTAAPTTIGRGAAVGSSRTNLRANMPSMSEFRTARMADLASLRASVKTLRKQYSPPVLHPPSNRARGMGNQLVSLLLTEARLPAAASNKGV